MRSEPVRGKSAPVIVCKRWHLAERCRDRGYTLAEAWPAVVWQAGDDIGVDPEHPAYPRPGLGDLVASGLAAVGITKRRVSVVAKAFGVRGCGCSKRQRALNALGRRLGFGARDPGENVERADPAGGRDPGVDVASAGDGFGPVA